MARTPTPDAQGDYLAGFSNFDCKLQDSHEYELMAPGVGIWSTLPNEQQAAWPVRRWRRRWLPVLLPWPAQTGQRRRTHRRLIMGQIATTGGLMQAYTLLQGATVSYDTPDAFLALTTVPQPKLSYLEHWTFRHDCGGSGNDDDGIVDAGETVDPAIVIRSHWGKADLVSVKLEAWAKEHSSQTRTSR